MNVIQGRREGFAMVGAVLAMVLVGAIVTGGFYAAHQESQVTRSTELGDVAQYIAETGLETAIANTSATWLDAMAYNQALAPANATNINVQYGGRTVGRYSVTITRVTQMMFVVRSTGTVTIGQVGNNTNSTRTVSNVVRLRVADFDNETAMQVYGDLEVGGTSDVAGADTYRSNWSGCTTTSGSAAVTAQPGASITTQGSGSINGTIEREAMTGTDFTVFGDMTWSEVTGMATNIYTGDVSLSQIDPVVNGTACNTSVRDNWGAPTQTSNACYNHFPIIWAQGNMHISANDYGQGILLVSGDLSIQSQFEFYGPIVVMGTVDFQGGAQILGSVFAYGGGVLGADNSTAGNMIVQYSSCGIKRAVMGATGFSRGVPIRNRSWIDLTAVQNSY